MTGLHVNRNKMKAIQLRFVGCARGTATQPVRLGRADIGDRFLARGGSHAANLAAKSNAAEYHKKPTGGQPGEGEIGSWVHGIIG